MDIPIQISRTHDQLTQAQLAEGAHVCSCDKCTPVTRCRQGQDLLLQVSLRAKDFSEAYQAYLNPSTNN